jgi:hypothetical protein
MPNQRGALLALARNASATESDSAPVIHLIQSEDAGRSPDELVADFAYTTDAANFHLAEFDSPPELRAFADALIGVSGGLKEFFATDATIAKRAGRSTKWVQRNRDEWSNWQTRENVTFIKIEDNYLDREGRRRPHKYVMHLPQLAVEAVTGARSGGSWSRSTGAAIARAVREQRGQIPTEAPRTRRGKKREPDAETLIAKNLRTAKTLIEKAAKLAESVHMQQEMFGSETPFQVDARLIQGLQSSLDALTAGEAQPEQAVSSSIKFMVDTVGDTGGGVVDILSTRESEAARALESFEAAEFGVTLLDETRPKDGEQAYEVFSREAFTSWLPNLLERNAKARTSLIVRPIGGHFVQLDDLSDEARAQVEPFSFLSVETSKGNFQAWVAVEGDRETLRRRLIAGVGADRGATGAMRWPGSINHKAGREGFTVRTVHTTPGRMASAEELEQAGLLAPVPPPSPHPPQDRPKATRAPRAWPDYQRSLTDAKRKSNGQPDRSDADKNWSILARERGWSENDIAAKLQEVSDKARQRPEYARRTASYASSVVSQNL